MYLYAYSVYPYTILSTYIAGGTRPIEMRLETVFQSQCPPTRPLDLYENWLGWLVWETKCGMEKKRGGECLINSLILPHLTRRGHDGGRFFVYTVPAVSNQGLGNKSQPLTPLADKSDSLPNRQCYTA